MERTALVLGATGGIGSETARALVKHGWRVRAVSRNPAQSAQRLRWIGAVEWRKADAMNPAEVLAAARGAYVIVHAVNPPGYKNWAGLQLPMLESSIAAARVVGARVVLPGTVYNFGADAFPVVDESAPQKPATRKGAIRRQMEARLEAAAREGVPVLIVRAGDFFGPHAGNNWFSGAIVKPGRSLRAVTYPGEHDVGHAWAYLPDLAEAIARLLDREAELAPFERFHFGGHWFERGVDLARATLRAAGVPNGAIRRFPWLLVRGAAPFVETLREMLEMRYLWSTPVRLDNRKLVAFLGEEPHTPLDEALRDTLAGLGIRRDPAAGAFSHA